MSKKKPLIIVESPAKIKTLKKFLGNEYDIESSVGHIRDLPKKDFGIDIENRFEPIYTTMEDKEKVIANLKKAAKKASIVYLSPDPDREGEAIAWHITQILPKETPYKRVSFNSITKGEVTRALANPREINDALVNAQQARRLLDRIVGYKISPILNRRLQRGRTRSVSAGRVQSAALKLVVDREREIEAFKPVEFWNISALLSKESEKRTFKALLYSVDEQRVDKEPGKEKAKKTYFVRNKEEADSIVERIKKGDFTVEKVEKKEKKRNAQPPFITSTLQQEASRHYGYSSSRTMTIAQQLYEGLDMGKEGTEGLITYMRTDSFRVEGGALNDARKYIHKTFGNDYLPEKPKMYSSKKNSQDAHEAIRPTNLAHHPELIKEFLTKEQYNLYQLVWKRFIASQMLPAIYDTLTVDISENSGLMLRATGSQLKFKGYLAAYREKEDDTDPTDEESLLPAIEEGDKLNLHEFFSEQAFTRPPPRFSEASLIKELEKQGIGRPSTYTAIMNKIQNREYTVKTEGRLKPTELGGIVAKMLEDHFGIIMDISFTANMEDTLEMVAEDKKDWHDLLQEFWNEFDPIVEKAIEEAVVPRITTDITCPKCKEGQLQKIWFKTKYFYGCTRYPDCDYTAAIEELEFSKEKYADDFDWDQPCPKCGKEMKVRHGRYGAFLGCSTYPDCRGIVQIPLKGEKVIAEKDLPACPAIDCPGKVTPRRSRFGKVFYSCSTFPECNVIVNELEDLESKYPNHPRTPYEKKTRGKKKGATSKKSTAKKKPRKKVEQKPVKLSKELATITGADEMTRPEALKKVWDYIKKEGLQDPNDKKKIVPDDKLAQVFGSKDPLPMTKILSVISKHVI